MDIERAFKWTRRKLYKTEQGRDMDWTRTRQGQDKDRQGQDKDSTRPEYGQETAGTDQSNKKDLDRRREQLGYGHWTMDKDANWRYNKVTEWTWNRNKNGQKHRIRKNKDKTET
jgi:hypothetical protein